MAKFQAPNALQHLFRDKRGITPAEELQLSRYHTASQPQCLQHVAPATFATEHNKQDRACMGIKNCSTGFLVFSMLYERMQVSG